MKTVVYIFSNYFILRRGLYFERKLSPKMLLSPLPTSRYLLVSPILHFIPFLSSSFFFSSVYSDVSPFFSSPVSPTPNKGADYFPIHGPSALCTVMFTAVSSLTQVVVQQPAVAAPRPVGLIRSCYSFLCSFHFPSYCRRQFIFACTGIVSVRFVGSDQKR
jgi:hypothetical protein